MDRIKLHDKYFRLFIPNEKIEAAIAAVAKKINEDYADSEPPVLLSVLNGSFMFTASLVKHLTFPAKISFIKVSSYCGTRSTGEMKQIIGLKESLKGQKVLIVEDIVDSGNTISCMHELLAKEGVKEVKTCTLILKPKAYKREHKIDYAAMELPNDFIVGFGLDYDELGRQYPDIYTLDE